MNRTLQQSFRQAFAGLAFAWRTQRNLRIHGLAAALVVGLIVILHLRPLEAAVLLLAVAAVVGAELVNTAVEVLVDRVVGLEHDPAAKTAKDVAAACVLVVAAGAALAGAAVLLPRVR
jgi:diacylglycerol kinase